MGEKRVYSLSPMESPDFTSSVPFIVTMNQQVQHQHINNTSSSERQSLWPHPIWEPAF
jgi:hypothetical protein